MYQWTTRDKLIYALSMIPFLIAFIGAAYLLGTISPLLTVALILLYLVVNIFQAGCCIGCPYRGRYCPAIFGVYPANPISVLLYRDREHDNRFFERNANIAQVLLGIILIGIGYFLATLSGWYLLALVLLLGIHVAIFMTLICPKCGFNETCPAGKASCLLVRRPPASR